MRRLIAVFMLALLPFQFSWSAVAAYCMHESSTSQSQHLGHHEHKHEAKGGNGQAEKSSQGADAFDVDCSVCHGAGIGALNWSDAKPVFIHESRVEPPSGKRLLAVTPTPPDRPQWSVLA